jgi:hypothetical protein
MNIDIQKIMGLFFKPAVKYSICGFVGQPIQEITTESDWARAQRAARRLYREGYRSVRIVRKNAEHTETWHYDGYKFTKAQ